MINVPLLGDTKPYIYILDSDNLEKEGYCLLGHISQPTCWNMSDEKVDDSSNVADIIFSK